ncbi:hypothetical protein FBU30_001838 [Linnemannia zychae]|nr:hypothetical protein FBU30_001838 [Linnemannia zychae]
MPLQQDRSMERTLDAFDKRALVSEIANPLQASLAIYRTDIQEIRKTIDDFQWYASIVYAIKDDLSIAHSAPKNTPKSKNKMALPNPFSGKCNDWKTFLDHLTLYITANEASFPIDSDKILFTISHLGDGSAFKYMIQFIPKLKEPIALHPAIITNFQTFLAIIRETFGV